MSWKYTGSNNHILEITSDQSGIEKYDIDIDNGKIEITYSYNGRSEVHVMQHPASIIRFVGDDDRDEFYNWTKIELHAYGHGGNDELWGGGGDDHLFGDGGEDYLYGQGGDDILDAGPDLVEGTVHGGPGDSDQASIRTYQIFVGLRHMNYRQGFRDAPRGVESFQRLTLPMPLTEFLLANR